MIWRSIGGKWLSNSTGIVSTSLFISSSCRGQKYSSGSSSSLGSHLTADLLGAAGAWRRVCLALAGFLQPVGSRDPGAWPIFSLYLVAYLLCHLACRSRFSNSSSSGCCIWFIYLGSSSSPKCVLATCRVQRSRCLASFLCARSI